MTKEELKAVEKDVKEDHKRVYSTPNSLFHKQSMEELRKKKNKLHYMRKIIK